MCTQMRLDRCDLHIAWCPSYFSSCTPDEHPPTDHAMASRFQEAELICRLRVTLFFFFELLRCIIGIII